MSDTGTTGTRKIMGLAAIGMGKFAIKLGNMALGKKGEEAATLPVPTKVPNTATKKKSERNYKGESEWEKATYRQFSVKIDRETGEAFAVRLKEDGVSLVDWFRTCVSKYMVTVDMSDYEGDVSGGGQD